MRLVFAGTPEFSVSALDALHGAGHEIVGVFTQPDRPAGRGRKLMPSPVAQRAAALGLPLYKPEKLRAEAQAELRLLAPEIMVVVAYGLILPQAVLDIPPRGCLNIHASLLPRWRGAAPIQRAIEAGDTETGITIMRMDAGLDTGPMLLREAVPIDEDTTAAVLHDRLAPLGARLIVEALAALEAGTLREQAQPAAGATYASKLSKEEARVAWASDAAGLARRVRAFNPVPVAWSELDGERVRILAARPAPAVDLPPGTIVAADDLRVACGSGSLEITRLQWPGGRVVTAQEAMAARRLGGRRFA
ncbi:methionyl-tRNA formyltransferase [Sinimarinibacterium flocculans]|uniref:Methionyl-tRNA formyltransferase n=1 Tax=Sinimarinibacterium flocculans TaxID=985250 RepID=A0A318E723_9GAMM|nr:methionyl-tRNA formyltransferase [Sinimarinibacterium flocculans]PXV66591.1 methionyl-tRNA formyltransferase [Sinimarinibacterium flocculans]